MNMTDRIQFLRKSRGISQEELADKIGVSRQAVSKWESEQSMPDIDKIITLSEFFDVTTDYLLKGIESEKTEVRKDRNAMVFTIVATVIIFCGLVFSWGYWYERQTALATVIGCVIMALGCSLHFIGLTNSNINKEQAHHIFWLCNIWFLAFLALAIVYNIVTARVMAPYPILLQPYYGYLGFWLLYVATATVVDLLQIVALKRKKNLRNN